MLKDISKVSASGSSVVCDYPDEFTFTDKAAERTQKQLMMAEKAGEKMKASYSKNELEEVLFCAGFKLYENLSPDEITEKYFNEYNLKNQDSIITAFDNVNYCYAVKE